MKSKKLTPADFKDKIIDCHSHVGINLKAYAAGEYPYSSSIEGVYYRQKCCGIDVNVVFPFTADLYFEPEGLIRGDLVKAKHPLSVVPYAAENSMLLREIYDYCPEFEGRFLPFISVDPGREIPGQLEVINNLKKQYPIYGIKIVPVFCQSKVTELLSDGSVFLDLARKNNWPVLLHTTTHKQEQYSRADMAFEVIEQNPDIRFCLAHCIGFDKFFLDKADKTANVWVDTSALTIQCQLAYEESEIVASKQQRFELDYSDHTKVMAGLAELYPQTIIWGTDTPAYSFICKRKQAHGVHSEFKLKAGYEDEVNALKCLTRIIRQSVSNINPLSFLYGKDV